MPKRKVLVDPIPADIAALAGSEDLQTKAWTLSALASAMTDPADAGLRAQLAAEATRACTVWSGTDDDFVYHWAQAVEAAGDVPPFASSAMDGYAVRSEEVGAATRENPVSLRLAGQVAAGEIFAGDIPARSCVRIFTGSAFPAATSA